MDEKEAKIEELCKRAVLAGLEGVEFLQGFDYAVLAREYNGIGPEWAGADIRAWVTRHAAIFEPAALIHDMRNYESDGLRYNFNQANVEFLFNCLRLADLAHPWYSWRRYRARLAAHAFFDFVSGPGGWKAWRDAHERKLNHKTSDIGLQTSKSGV